MKSSDYIQLFLERVSPEAVLEHAQGGFATLLGGAAGIVFAMTELFEDGLVDRARVQSWLDVLGKFETLPLAFEFPDFEPTKLTNGHMSGTLAVPFARAYAAAALGDLEVARTQTRSFVTEGRNLTVDPELVLRELWGGTAGLTFVTDILAKKFAKHGAALEPEQKALAGLRAACVAELLQTMQTPFADRKDNALGRPYIGMAHGFAGEVYAALLASERIPDSVITRLDELASWSTREDKLVAWPTVIGDEIPPPLWGTYCNGTPGMLELWATAYEKTGNKEYLELARLSAETTFGLLTPIGSLCCGMAGQGVALVRYGERCDDPKAIDRGKRRIRQTFEMECPEPGLMKGDAGIALVALDILKRRRLRMPLVNPIG